MPATGDITSDPPEVDVTLPKNKDLPKRSKDWKHVQLPIDFLLLTAENCEFLACLSHLNAGFFKSYHKTLGYVYFGDIGDDEMRQKIAVIKCNRGSSVQGSVIVVPNAVKILRPKAVFSVGFCGGLNAEKVKLGDVVVSAKLITYAPTKVTQDGIQERGVSVPLKKYLAQLIQNADDGWEAPLIDPDKLKVDVHRDGVFLSGPEVVDNKDRRKQLMERFPQAIAIEMEGEGLYTAAHDLDVEWIVIKGVSDFADGRESKKDAWRTFASIMAASLTAHILSDPLVFKDWPHFGDESATESKTSSVSSTAASNEPSTVHHAGARASSSSELKRPPSSHNAPQPAKKRKITGGDVCQ